MVMLKNKLCSVALVLIGLLSVVDAAEAQVIETRRRVDTLALAERIAVRTNMIDWTLLIPNAGVEFDILNTNWNRWTVGLNLRYNWQSDHTFSSGLVYDVKEIRMEFRNYWRFRELNDKNGILPHDRFIDRLFSCRRTRVRHPLITYYRGLYLAYSGFSIKLGKYGKQGNDIYLGFTYGMVRPLYEFGNGNTLDFEAGVSAGIAYRKYDKYVHDRESNCYPLVEKGRTSMVPSINELRVGFVYRFGKYPILKKYRWRIETDAAYIDSMRSMQQIMETERQNKINAANRQKEIHKAFFAVYDSVANVNGQRLKQVAGKAGLLRRDSVTADMKGNRRKADKRSKKKNGRNHDGMLGGLESKESGENKAAVEEETENKRGRD